METFGNNIRNGYKKLLEQKSKEELIELVLDFTDDNANLSVRCEELFEWLLVIQKMVDDGEITL